MTYQFNQAQEADAAAVFQLYRRCAAKGAENGSSEWDDQYPSWETIREDLEQQALYVLKDQDKVIGAVTLLLEDEEMAELDIPWSSGTYFVTCRLCVDPDYQCQGLGERILQHAFEMEQKNGIQYNRLLAPIVNLASNRLYQKMGYRMASEKVTAYGIAFRAYERRIR